MILTRIPLFCRWALLAAVLAAQAVLCSPAFAQTVQLTPATARNVLIQKDKGLATKPPAKDANKKPVAEPVKPMPVAPPRIEPLENGDWFIFDAPDNTLLVSRSSIRIYKNALDGQDVYHAYVLKRHVPPIQLPKLKPAVATQSMGLSFICGYEAMMVASEEYTSVDLTVVKKSRSKDFPLSKEMRPISAIPGLANVKTFLCQSKEWPVVEITEKK